MSVSIHSLLELAFVEMRLVARARPALPRPAMARLSSCRHAPAMFAAAALVLTNLMVRCSAAGAVGGAQPAKAAGKEVQALVDSVREAARQRASAEGGNGNFSRWEALQVRTQLVAGTNYFVKVAVSDDRCVHVRIYEPLPYTRSPAKLVGIKLDQGLDKDIEYFEASPDPEPTSSDL